MAKLVSTAKVSNNYYIINRDPAESHSDIKAEEENYLNGTRKKAEFILQGAMRKAAMKLQEAEDQCRLILQKTIGEAEQQLEAIKEKAFKEGYEEGLKKGREQAETEKEDAISSFTEEMEKRINKGLEEYQNMINKLEGEIVDLSLTIAEKIIRQEAVSNNEMVLLQIREALKRLTDRSKITIRVSHKNMEMLNNCKDRLMTMQDDIKELIIVEDLRIDEGECIVETSSGTVDGRINNQMDEIKRNFLTILEQEADD